MANNGKNIPMVPIDSKSMLEQIRSSGFSLKTLAEKIGISDSSIRTYIKNGQIPEVTYNKIFYILVHNEKEDNVNKPGHYTFGKIEVINYIRDKMSPEEFQGFCMGNVLKYVSRHKHKNGVEDLKKAEVYLKWLIESEEAK